MDRLFDCVVKIHRRYSFMIKKCYLERHREDHTIAFSWFLRDYLKYLSLYTYTDVYTFSSSERAVASRRSRVMELPGNEVQLRLKVPVMHAKCTQVAESVYKPAIYRCS